MQLRAAIVVFAASLPHAVVRHPVGSLHAEHQILDEGDLRRKQTSNKSNASGHKELMQQISKMLACAPTHNDQLVKKTDSVFKLQQHIQDKDKVMHGYTLTDDLLY